MNKGRQYRLPGIGLAGDWPGGWTQTFAQMDTEAGAHGFDQDYFVQQVAGLSQLTGEFMLVRPAVIDLGWGLLKSALVKLRDADFVKPHESAAQRQRLVDHYVSAFRHVEKSDPDGAKSAFKDLAAGFSVAVVPDHQRRLGTLLDDLRSRLT
jgi:hypothetical protein